MLAEDVLKKMAREIEKTGFPLEYRTAKILGKSGWNVISSKYYIDDVEEIPREIDMIAYRMRQVGDLQVYTCLIVSCKKSENKPWALLSKRVRLDDPNMNWWPLTLWSNNKHIDYQINLPDRKKQYHRDAVASGISVMDDPAFEIFAFQEMTRDGGLNKGNVAVQSAIQSLLKAQAYEMSTLPVRKKSVPSLYQFNLVNVLDGELVRLEFTEDDVLPSSIASERLVSHYIIDKKQIFSRVHIVTEEAFAKTVSEYDALHEHNCKNAVRLSLEFFSDAIFDPVKRNLCLPDFRKMMLSSLRWHIPHILKVPLNFEALDIGKDGNGVSILTEIWEDEQLAKINGDERVKELTAKALAQAFQYTGDFKFENDIPF